MKILFLRQITIVLQSTTYSLQGCSLNWERKKNNQTEEAFWTKGETSSSIQERSAAIYDQHNPQMRKVYLRKATVSLCSNIAAKPSKNSKKMFRYKNTKMYRNNVIWWRLHTQGCFTETCRNLEWGEGSLFLCNLLAPNQTAAACRAGNYTGLEWSSRGRVFFIQYSAQGSRPFMVLE